MFIDACKGKEKYVSPQLARKVLTRRQRKAPKIQVYRCRYCGFFHIGRTRKEMRW